MLSKTRYLQILTLIYLPFALFSHCVSANPLIQNYASLAQPVWSAQGMVSSQQAIATRVGVDILKQGGNAIDAAVAVGSTQSIMDVEGSESIKLLTILILIRKYSTFLTLIL